MRYAGRYRGRRAGAAWPAAAVVVGVVCAFVTLTLTGTYDVAPERDRAPLVTVLPAPTSGPAPQPTLTPPVGPTGALVGSAIADARDGVAP